MGGRSEADHFAAAWTREFPRVHITEAEAEVVFFMARGYTIMDTANRVSRSHKTVESHFCNVGDRAYVPLRLLRYRLIFAMGREAGIDEGAALRQRDGREVA